MNRRTAVTQLSATALGLAVPWQRARSGDAATHPDVRTQATEDEALLLRLASVPAFAMVQVSGDTISTHAAGVKRAGEPALVDEHTVFAAASLTKLVTAYIALSLTREKVLSLDTPVREYLALPNADDRRADKIKLRHLLSHSSGWRNWRFNATQALVCDFDPGARWQYSGEGFFFTQRIAEQVTGKGFSRLARERLFEPLGMHRSSLTVPEEFEAWMATGHNSRAEPAAPFGRPTLLELRRMMASRNLPLDNLTVADSEQAIRTAEPQFPALPNFLAPNGAASLITTARDFGALLRHLMGTSDKDGHAREIVSLMMSPQVTCNEAIQWGLGAGLEKINGRLHAWQWGDNSGFKNFYHFDPSSRTAMAVFTNGDKGARVYERVIRAQEKMDHPAFLFV